MNGKLITKLLIISMMTLLAGCESEEVVLDPVSFGHEVGYVYQTIEKFNLADEYRFLSKENHVFQFKYLKNLENEYEMLFQRKDGVMVYFLFNRNEMLKEVRLYASKEDGKKLTEKGIDIGSMLMYEVIGKHMELKNQYDFMFLCRDFYESIKVSLEDPKLKVLVIEKSKENHEIKIKLASNRMHFVE